MLTPAKRATPGRPRAVPWNVTSPHVEPASITPVNVKRPAQPPPRAPVARKLSGAAAGRSVSPGSFDVTPVGASGVPPHVHVLAARAGPAPVNTSVAATPPTIIAIRIAAPLDSSAAEISEGLYKVQLQSVRT